MERKKLIITVVAIVASVSVIGGIFLILWASGAFSSSNSSPPVTNTTTTQRTTVSSTASSTTTTVSTTSTTPDPTEYYTAAVVEYNKYIDESNPQVEANTNLLEYIKIIESTEVLGSDIVVFPEGGLNNFETAQFIPEPEDEIVPCRNPDYDTILSQLSCSAITESLYLVVNLREKSICPDVQQIRLNDPRPCNESGTNYYNTNVVFDRSGKVIAKYRKFNLFNEPGILQPYKSETSTFDTDFGVTFGIFTCFDILFEKPAFDLVREGITNFIMTTWWYSEVPYLTGVQTQQAWAYTHNVNLLAAGVTNPSIGSTGSGIYHGRKGGMRYTIQGIAKTEVLKANVPPIRIGGIPIFPTNRKSPDEMLGLSMLKDQVENFNTFLIIKPQFFDLCSGNLCCNFDIQGQFDRNEESDAKYYEYYAVVYNGKRSFAGAADGNVKICGIMACTSRRADTCGERFPAGTKVEERSTFNYLKIKGDFKEEVDGKLLMLPSSIDTSIVPYEPDRMTYNYVAETTTHEMSIVGPRKDILSFGLYAIFYGTQ